MNKLDIQPETPIERTLEQKALLLIERLVSDDLAFALEYDVAMERELKLSQGDLKILADKLSTIYRISHAVRKDAVCYSVHEDWRQELEERYCRLRLLLAC